MAEAAVTGPVPCASSSWAAFSPRIFRLVSRVGSTWYSCFGAVQPPPSASLVSPVTRCHVDLVYSVAIPVGFAEERAMLAFEVDPSDVKPEFFGVPAERDGDRIAECCG